MTIGEWIEKLFESKAVREMINSSDWEFYMILDLLKVKHHEAKCRRMADENNPAFADTPEG